MKAFFIIFKGLSVVKNCLRPESVLLKICAFIYLRNIFPKTSIIDCYGVLRTPPKWFWQRKLLLPKKWSYIENESVALKYCDLIISSKLRENCPHLRFLWSLFFSIWTEYGGVQSKFPYLSKCGKIYIRKTSNTDHLLPKGTQKKNFWVVKIG